MDAGKIQKKKKITCLFPAHKIVHYGSYYAEKHCAYYPDYLYDSAQSLVLHKDVIYNPDSADKMRMESLNAAIKRLMRKGIIYKEKSSEGVIKER